MGLIAQATSLTAEILMKMDEKATTSTLIIVSTAMAIAVCLSIAFGFFAGVAGLLFAYVVFFMLDSIDSNLSTIAKLAEDQERRREQLRYPVETYTSKGEKADLKA